MGPVSSFLALFLFDQLQMCICVCVCIYLYVFRALSINRQGPLNWHSVYQPVDKICLLPLPAQNYSWKALLLLAIIFSW